MTVTRLRGFAAAAARAWLSLRYRRFGRRYGKLVLEAIDGVPLLVLPQVFNPVLLRSGALLAHALERLPAEALAGKAVLDLGTGSGVGAVFAARQGASVVAVDLNPEAVRCAKINTLLNELEGQIKVTHGDLFEPIVQQRFDLVLFNPPYYRGIPTDPLDHAWRGTDVFERFADGLGRVLTKTGHALLVLSTDGDCNELLELLRARQFAIEIIERTDLINEVVTIYAVRPS